MLLPCVAPVFAPVRRRIRLPAAKVRRRRAVVAHRDSQHKQRHEFRGHPAPRPVVPGARVPDVVPVHPVHAIVEEEVRIQSRRVVDGIAGHSDELGEHGQVDADAHAGENDADAHLGKSRRDRADQHPQYKESISHFCAPSRLLRFSECCGVPSRGRSHRVASSPRGSSVCTLAELSRVVLYAGAQPPAKPWIGDRATCASAQSEVATIGIL